MNSWRGNGDGNGKRRRSVLLREHKLAYYLAHVVDRVVGKLKRLVVFVPAAFIRNKDELRLVQLERE